MRVLLALAVIVGACSGPTSQLSFTAEEVSLGEDQLTVWVADDPEERRQGLRDVESLPGGIDGMLFAYSAPVSATFNMRNTLMALDIWWFDSEGILLGSAGMRPCEAEPCTSYRSPGPIRWALETPAGRYDFVPGATLSTVASG